MSKNQDCRPKQIRITQKDGEIGSGEKSALWLSGFIDHVRQYAGENPTLRIGAYKHGSATYFAIDVFAKNDSDGMVLTIGFGKDLLLLPSIFDSHMDIELPGLIDALKIVSILKETTNGQITIATDL